MEEEAKEVRNTVETKECKQGKKIGAWGCCGIFCAGFFLFITVSVVMMGRACASCASTISSETTGKEAETEFLCGNPNSSNVIAVIDIRGIILPEEEVFGSQIVSPERTFHLCQNLKRNAGILFG